MPYRATQYRPPHLSKSTRAASEAARGSRHERGYTARWTRFAKQYLRSHPVCVLHAAAGRTVAAQAVDHIDSLGPLGPRGYDETNLRALCHSCHNRRTAQERHAGEKGRPT